MQSKVTKSHPYILCKNTETKWLPSDTQELFEENCANNRSKLEQYKWLDTSITYKFNSEGFRADEFDKKGGVMFLGCSFTFGLGLPVEQTFARIVSKELDTNCFNLGLPASSNDTAFRFADLWIPVLEPSIVVLLSPLPMRFEILSHEVSSDEAVSRFVTTMDQISNTADKSKWLDTNQNGLLNRRKNKLAIEKLCDDRKIKFVHDNTEDLKIVDFARDLSHPGTESNKLFADKILSKVQV